MSWFVTAKNFEKRNIINAKIRYLTEIRAELAYLSKFIFQSGKNAKEANYKIITSDKITSYPSLHEILIQADSMALDSPWKFASLCGEAISKIDKLTYSLRSEREEFIHGDGQKKPMKGWVD
jgi:hypothetical protein